MRKTMAFILASLMFFFSGRAWAQAETGQISGTVLDQQNNVPNARITIRNVGTGRHAGPHAMEAMEHIQKQHRWFAATGFGVALANGLAGTLQMWQQLFKKAWPVLLIVLGILLMQYTEQQISGRKSASDAGVERTSRLIYYLETRRRGQEWLTTSQ